MLFNSTVYQIGGGGELKETTGEINPNVTVHIPVTGVPAVLAIVRASTYFGYIGLDSSVLTGVYLFNGKTSTNPTLGIYTITVLFNGDSEMLITNRDSETFYYRYVELV